MVISDNDISEYESDIESELDASEWPDTRWPGPEFVCRICGYEFEDGPFEGTVHDNICSLYCFGLMQ